MSMGCVSRGLPPARAATRHGPTWRAASQCERAQAGTQRLNGGQSVSRRDAAFDRSKVVAAEGGAMARTSQPGP